MSILTVRDVMDDAFIYLIIISIKDATGKCQAITGRFSSLPLKNTSMGFSFVRTLFRFEKKGIDSERRNTELSSKC